MKHECFIKNRKKKSFKQAHRSNSDNGKSSHIISLPQLKLSEGFENVYFFKRF